MTNRIRDTHVTRRAKIAALRRDEAAEQFLRLLMRLTKTRFVGLADSRQKLDRRLSELRPSQAEWQSAE